MLQKNILCAVFLLALGGSANALNSIDTFIRDHCGDVCNGESPDCKTCYNEAVDLYDQKNPVSPEVNWDLQLKNGKLELKF